MSLRSEQQKLRAKARASAGAAKAKREIKLAEGRIKSFSSGPGANPAAVKRWRAKLAQAKAALAAAGGKAAPAPKLTAKEKSAKGMQRFVKSFQYDKPIREYKKLHGRVPTVDQLELFVEGDKMLAAADKQDKADEAKEAQAYARTAKGLGVSEERAKKLVSQFDKQAVPTTFTQGRHSYKKGFTGPAPKAKAKEPAKAQSKGAPNLPKNWRSLPTSHPDRVAFRSWYKKNRPSAPKTAVAKAVATKKAAPKTAAPARTADLTGLQKRIEMKRKSGQAIPAAWLKAEKTAKAKARVAKAAQSSKRIPSSIDRQENQKEAARGRKEMAARKTRLSADADRRATKENLAEVQRGRKEMSERKANVAGDKARRKTQRQAQLDPLIVAKQKADVARDKTATEERVVRMRKDAAERAKRKQMQAKMSALPGFRSN